jgi:dienelactone hydrolase
MNSIARSYVILIFFITGSFRCIAQDYNFVKSTNKASLDLSAIKNWEYTGNGMISNDGKCVCMSIYNCPVGKNTLVISSTNNLWKKEFIGATSPTFTSDSKMFIFKINNDSLCILDLSTYKQTYISYVNVFKVISDRNENWLAYEPKSLHRKLIVKNLSTGKDTVFSYINSYIFNSNSILLLETQSIQNNDTTYSLQWINLRNGNGFKIFSGIGMRLSTYSFDLIGKQLVFVMRKFNYYELYYYREGMEGSIMLVNNQTSGIPYNMIVANKKPKFSDNGRQIYFGLKYQPIKGSEHYEGTQVDVWSYVDLELKSQLTDLNKDAEFTSVVNLDSKKIVRLEGDYERVIANTNDWALIKHELGVTGYFEANWNLSAQFVYTLVSTKNGYRKLLKDHILDYNGGLTLSPSGKWIIYYDPLEKNYFSYEVETGITTNITYKCLNTWVNESDDRPAPSLPGSLKWLSKDSAVLIQDSYDIWQIDPSGRNKPVNLTNGFGRANQIKFEVFNDDEYLLNLLSKKGFRLYLRAFDKLHKNMGFYRTSANERDPEMLSMGAYVYGGLHGYNSFDYWPQKAKNSDVYLLKRMSATEAPNYWITKDFKKFIKITNIQPQKKYNWHTTELHTWRAYNGELLQGILYKPENFDSTKKYPVIFNYYEKKSDELNLFLEPKASEDEINIPLFVSQGYLVFTPDIHYLIGQPGESAYNSVVSAAEHMSKLNWIDKERMGLQGHSWGAFQTNYIVTHTNIFSAACSASGVSNLISSYGSAARGGYPMYHAERDQGRMGGTLWELRDLYLKNSPVLYADKVSTPLLLMNNKGDNIVPFSQGVEFFTALRRLGKRVWMLQYDNGRHSVGEEDAIDYHKRLIQFFDHYLKGEPSPEWMTRGIPASLKGRESRMEGDKFIKTPGPGLNLKIPELDH